MHEGNLDPYVGTTDYIAAFAIEGKLLNVMNLWRVHDIVEVCMHLPATSLSIAAARATDLAAFTRTTTWCWSYGRCQRGPHPCRSTCRRAYARNAWSLLLACSI